MKTLSKMLSELYVNKWLITAAAHNARREAIKAKLDGVTIEIPSIESDEVEPTIESRCMIIPVHGVIGQHLDAIEVRYFGGCDLDNVNSAIDDAENDDGIDQVIFNFNTPGGTVTGIPETAFRISEMTKNTIAFTDSQCCSGGLYLASQCQRFYCTPSSDVGSCGVYSIFADYTRMLSEAGIKVNAIVSGEMKLAGAYFREMTDAERAMFLADVKDIHEEFKAAVNAIRSVDASHLEGQIYSGRKSVAVGFCTDVVQSFDGLLNLLNSEME